MANSTIDSPYEAHIEDSDSDYAEQLYGQLPPDHVGFMEGSLTDTRRRRNGT
jgi:hypothetical protein